MFRQIGVDIPRTADAQYYSYPKVSASNLQPGDLVFFETYEPGPSHCGIYIGNGQMLQAGSSTGVTVSMYFPGISGPLYRSLPSPLKEHKAVFIHEIDHKSLNKHCFSFIFHCL